eukprot:gene14254-16823_t
MFMKHYPKPVVMEAMFGVSRRTIMTYFHEMLEVIHDLAKNSFAVHLKERDSESNYRQWFDKLGNPYNITAVVDGVEQRVAVPTSRESKTNFYSAKKAYNSVTKLVYANPQGKIMAISNSASGAHNDMGLVHRSKMMLDTFDIPWEYVIGDKGFRGADKLHERFLIPRAKGYNKQDPLLYAEQKRFKSIRIIIENVFAA